MEDLVLTKEADDMCRFILQRAYNIGYRAAKAWADCHHPRSQTSLSPQSTSTSTADDEALNAKLDHPVEAYIYLGDNSPHTGIDLPDLPGS
jgi:hypothetical protein